MCFVFILGFIALNILAFNHSQSMMTFSQGISRTLAPEKFKWYQKIKVLIVGVEINRPDNVRTPSDIGLEFENVLINNQHQQSVHGWFV